MAVINIRELRRKGIWKINQGVARLIAWDSRELFPALAGWSIVP